MYIKGRENGCCNQCEYGFFDEEKKQFLCMDKNEETCEDNTCKKFRFDIHKYKPKKRLVFGKYSQEDFTL